MRCLTKCLPLDPKQPLSNPESRCLQLWQEGRPWGTTCQAQGQSFREAEHSPIPQKAPAICSLVPMSGEG